jgi:hypothetical protein
MARVLTVEETREFLSRHPDITADKVPSYGLRVTEGQTDYLVGIVHATGEIKVIDITAHDEQGNRIDPNISSFQSLWDAITSSVAEAPGILLKRAIGLPDDFPTWIILVVGAGITLGVLYLSKK